jgi:hypothetical protein
MRTTLVLEDRLFREAKRLAATRGVTLSEVVNDALRAALARPVLASTQFVMVTFGERKKAVRHEPRDFVNAVEEEDRASLGR